MGQIIADDFHRANSTGLGANWTIITLAGDSGWNVASLQAVGSAPAGFGMASYSGAGWTGGADHYSEVTITGIGSGNDAGPSCRVSGASFGGGNQYIFDINDTDAAISLPSSAFSVALYKQVGGSFSQVGSSVTGQTIASGTVLRIEAQGTTIRCKIGGVTVITQTDSSLSAGLPGFYCGTASAATSWSLWAAGDFSVAAIVDGPRGDRRPFPFTPSSAPQRM
jgi:hypothetical protein